MIHTAFIHDFSDYAANGEIDRLAVEAIGAVLVGSGRSLVITSGTAVLPSGCLAIEDKEADPNSTAAPRVASEQVVLAMARGCVPQWCACRPQSIGMTIAALFRL